MSHGGAVSPVRVLLYPLFLESYLSLNPPPRGRCRDPAVPAGPCPSARMIFHFSSWPCVCPVFPPECQSWRAQSSPLSLLDLSLWPSGGPKFVC